MENIHYIVLTLANHPPVVPLTVSQETQARVLAVVKRMGIVGIHRVEQGESLTRSGLILPSTHDVVKVTHTVDRPLLEFDPSLSTSNHDPAELGAEVAKIVATIADRFEDPVLMVGKEPELTAEQSSAFDEIMAAVSRSRQPDAQPPRQQLNRDDTPLHTGFYL